MLVEHLDGAKERVYVMAYSFTHPKIALALVRCKQRGLDVQVVINMCNRHERNSKVDLLKADSIPVTFDRDKNIMHNKVMIIDDLVVQGSFNFTLNADLKNGENLNFIKDEPQVVEKYLADFLRHRGHSRP